MTPLARKRTTAIVVIALFAIGAATAVATGVYLSRLGAPPVVTSLGGERIEFANYDLGFLVAGNKLFRSRDGGRRWTQMQVPTQRSAFISGFQFFPSGFGWMNLESGIAETVSYGEEWSLQPKPLKYPVGVMETMFFLSDRVGWAGGGEYVLDDGRTRKPNFAIDRRADGTYALRPVVLATTDSGKSWSTASISGEGAFSIRKISFADAKSGFAGSVSSIFHSNDSGKTWTAVYRHRSALDGASLQDLFVLGDNAAWASFNDGIIVKTDDFGKHWRAYGAVIPAGLSESSGPFYPVQMWYWSTAHGLALDNSLSQLCETRDGGRSWSVVLPQSKVRAFAAIDARHIWVLTESGVFQLVGLAD